MATPDGGFCQEIAVPSVIKNLLALPAQDGNILVIVFQKKDEPSLVKTCPVCPEGFGTWLIEFHERTIPLLVKNLPEFPVISGGNVLVTHDAVLPLLDKIFVLVVPSITGSSLIAVQKFTVPLVERNLPALPA
jgi:hypothetical protein